MTDSVIVSEPLICHNRSKVLPNVNPKSTQKREKFPAKLVLPRAVRTDDGWLSEHERFGPDSCHYR